MKIKPVTILANIAKRMQANGFHYPLRRGPLMPTTFTDSPFMRGSHTVAVGEVRVALWPILIVLYATLLPREIRFTAGGLTFFADRIGLIIVLPYVLKKVLDGTIRLVLPDFLMLFSILWILTSMSVHYGVVAGLQRGGSLALDSTVGYFLARISFRSLRDIRRALVYFAPGLFVAAAAMAVESITHHPFVLPVARSIFGPLPFYISGEATGVRNAVPEVRLGLLRAQGPFSHPILAGLYLTAFLPIYARSGLRGWPTVAGTVAALCSVFAVSSAALLGLILVVALLAFDTLQRYFRDFGWKQLITILAIIGGAAQLFTSNGIVGVLTRLALDPATAYYRRLTWQFASVSVGENPMFGIGFAGYARPAWMISESIDAHWLLLAVRFGLPDALAVFAATVIAIIAVGQASIAAPPVDRRFIRGIGIALVVMTTMMFTVTLWGAAQILFTILLGASVACAQRRHPKTETVR
jgi:hypothetical protein